MVSMSVEFPCESAPSTVVKGLNSGDRGHNMLVQPECPRYRPLRAHMQVTITIAVVMATLFAAGRDVPPGRPPKHLRKFHSAAVESMLANYTARMPDKNLSTLFTNCFPNTLDTTVMEASANESFIITGDIPAMWLRDSTNQVLPYIPLMLKDAALQSMIRGVVMRQLRSVLIDSYANSYNKSPRSPDAGEHQSDCRLPPMNLRLFEGKYELDSLCAVLKLTYHYVNTSGDTELLTTEHHLFLRAVDVILTTMENQSMSTEMQAGNVPYRFYRVDAPWEIDAYPNRPVADTGLIRSAFRPSDDQTLYDFLVPSNAMAHVELGHVIELLEMLVHSAGEGGELPPSVEGAPHPVQLVARAHEKREFVLGGLRAYAIHCEPHRPTPSSCRFAYEVDGFNHSNVMDDPNVPGLLSLPYLGFRHLPDIVLATRDWVLSNRNPYYYCGSLGCGLGSPHTLPGYIWPMGLIVEAFTSHDATHVKSLLHLLVESGLYNGFMRESFNPNDAMLPGSRPWFAWANTMFGALIVNIGERFPQLIFG